jgi:hypothetical protein
MLNYFAVGMKNVFVFEDTNEKSDDNIWNVLIFTARA